MGARLSSALPTTWLTPCAAAAQGEGLLKASELVPVASHIIMALLDLREGAASAKGNRANCLQLEAFGQDIMRAFDFHGAAESQMFQTLLEASVDIFRYPVSRATRCEL